MCPADGADFPDWLNGADLVVGVHDGNKAGFRTEGRFNFFRTDHTVLMHIQQGDFKALGFQLLQGMEHGVMFKGGGNDVVLSFFLSRKGGGTDRLIIGFAAAGGEIDFPGLRVDHGRNILPGLFQYFFSLLTDTVQAGGISVILPHTTGHSFNGRLTHGGGRGVIRVNAHSGNSFSHHSGGIHRRLYFL